MKNPPQLRTQPANAFPAPGSNGPGPMAQGFDKVITSAGDPNFTRNSLTTQQKGQQVPLHPSHRSRADRGSWSRGQDVLDAGNAAAGEDSAS